MPRYVNQGFLIIFCLGLEKAKNREKNFNQGQALDKNET